MASEKQIKYQNEWMKENVRYYRMIVNKKTEKPIIDQMNKVSNNSEYLKSLVKSDMQNAHIRKVYMLDLTGSANNRLIKHLDSQANVSKYLENLVLNDMTK